MTVMRVVELWCSLCLQVTIVIACAAYLARRVVQEDRSRDRLWTVCLLAVLLTTISGLCLPHLRILPTAAAQVGSTNRAADRAARQLAHGYSRGLGHRRIFYAGARCRQLLRLAAPERSQRYSRGSLAGAVGNDASGNWFYGLSGAGRTIHFLSVAQVFSPFCWQWQQPTIVLPEMVLDFSPEEIAAVIRHELAHLRYAHPLWLFLQRIVEAAYWFHPVVRWAGRQAVAAREFAADRHAAPTPEDAAALLRGLLHLTQLDCVRNGSNLAIRAVGASPSILAARARKLGAREE